MMLSFPIVLYQSLSVQKHAFFIQTGKVKAIPLTAFVEAVIETVSVPV